MGLRTCLCRVPWRPRRGLWRARYLLPGTAARAVAAHADAALLAAVANVVHALAASVKDVVFTLASESARAAASAAAPACLSMRVCVYVYV